MKRKSNILARERIKGVAEIMDLFERIYDITTWRGAKRFIERNKLPLRYKGNRPFFFKDELIAFELRYLERSRKQKNNKKRRK
jgi:hypothetical protein